MTRLIEKQGDLFATQAGAIGHGVNCRGLMGAGIAVKFRAMFPDMYEIYAQLCRKGMLTPGRCFSYFDRGTGTLVCNIASQKEPGADADYKYLVGGVAEALDDCRRHNIPVLALPYIGAGIGGLKPESVKKWLKELADSGPVDIELWEFKP